MHLSNILLCPKVQSGPDPAVFQAVLLVVSFRKRGRLVRGIFLLVSTSSGSRPEKTEGEHFSLYIISGKLHSREDSHTFQSAPGHLGLRLLFPRAY